jgi:DnaK suppressor protein
MNIANLEDYRRELQSILVEFTASHRNVDAIAVERVADSMDEVVLAGERDLALRALTREAFLYRQVCAALERLAAGTFGSCLQCDGPIAEKRLRALPWAALCVRCQEAADNAGEPENSSPSGPFSAAA